MFMKSPFVKYRSKLEKASHLFFSYNHFRVFFSQLLLPQALGSVEDQLQKATELIKAKLCPGVPCE
jgi:hypothetical protein